MRHFRPSWLLGAAVCLFIPCRPAPAQDDQATLREASSPGRIDGQAAEKYRNALAAQPAPSAPVAVSTTPAVAPPLAPAVSEVPPAPAPQRNRAAALGAALLLALAALVAAKIGKQRKAETERLRAEAERLRAAAPPPPKPDDEAALLAGAADQAKRDALADYVLRAHKSSEFLSRCQGRPDALLAGYAMSFLKLGAWEVSASLLRGKKIMEPREQVLCQTLQAVVAGRGGRPPAEVYVETLLVAAELSRRGGHEDAMALLSPAVAQRAAGGASDCLVVAGVTLAAGKVPEFLAQAKVRKQAQFYKAYAAAFHALRAPETALALIRMKQPMEPSDYSLFVACHKELGRVGELNLAAVPDADRLALAEALTQAGEDAAGLRALLDQRLEALGKADQALALRICRRLKDTRTAGKLFQHIKLTVGLADAPELYLLHALVCEEAGQPGAARDIYDEILRRFPGHPEASEGLRRLQSRPI
jgi:hypothetical protein